MLFEAETVGKGETKILTTKRVCPFTADKDFIKRAFRLAIDAHRTVLPLSYPPHAIAAACLYLTSYLTPEGDLEGLPQFGEGWAESVRCTQEDIEGK